jgi:hypothetical protein
MRHGLGYLSPGFILGPRFHHGNIAIEEQSSQLSDAVKGGSSWFPLAGLDYEEL